MIGLKVKSLVKFFRAVVLICLSLYYLLQWIKLLLGGHVLKSEPISFGFPFTNEWVILNLIFWFSILFGSVFLFTGKNLGSILINGALLSILTYLGFEIVNNLSASLIYLQTLLILVILLSNKPSPKTILQSFILYIFWGILFLTISQR